MNAHLLYIQSQRITCQLLTFRSEKDDAVPDPSLLLTVHVKEYFSSDTPAQKVRVSRHMPFRSFVKEWSRDFDDERSIEVCFYDSLSTVDDGGPRREFLYRLLKDIINNGSVFQPSGETDALSITHSAQKLESRMYYWAGRAIATILVHGGPSIAIFTGAVYQCIAYGCDEAEPDIKDVPCAVVRRFLTDVSI